MTADESGCSNVTRHNTTSPCWLCGVREQPQGRPTTPEPADQTRAACPSNTTCRGTCETHTPIRPADQTRADVVLTEAERETLAEAYANNREVEWVERIIADRLATERAEHAAEVEAQRRDRDDAREALDNYLSDPPLPIGNDVIAEAQKMVAALSDDNRAARREIERLRERLAEADER